MSAIEKYKVQMFGASVDPVEQNKKFAELNKYNFPLLSDPEKSYAKTLGVLNPANGFTYRWTYVIDDKGTIVEIDKMVKPGSHGKELAAKLEALGIPKK
jgi:thioredoxin-dependent peroxiredoxin